MSMLGTVDLHSLLLGLIHEQSTCRLQHQQIVGPAWSSQEISIILQSLYAWIWPIFEAGSF